MKLYKAKELAEILHINVQTIYRCGRDGRIKTIRVGRAVRFVMPEIDMLNEELTPDKQKGASSR